MQAIKEAGTEDKEKSEVRDQNAEARTWRDNRQEAKGKGEMAKGGGGMAKGKVEMAKDRSGRMNRQERQERQVPASSFRRGGGVYRSLPTAGRHRVTRAEAGRSFLHQLGSWLAPAEEPQSALLHFSESQAFKRDRNRTVFSVVLDSVARRIIALTLDRGRLLHDPGEGRFFAQE